MIIRLGLWPLGAYDGDLVLRRWIYTACWRLFYPLGGCDAFSLRAALPGVDRDGTEYSSLVMAMDERDTRRLETSFLRAAHFAAR